MALERRYSFSGADVRAFVYFEGMEDTIRPLEALHTLSISVHEGKGQVRSLGFRGIKGLARGIRTIGGSLILPVIEDNPLRPLMENLRDFVKRNNTYWPGWSIDRHEVGTGSAFSNNFHFSNRIAPLLPPFNILVKYVSEAALWFPSATKAEVDNDLGVSTLIEGAGLLLRGVEFLDEGIVTSANDVITETSLSFIARDYKPLSAQVFDGGPLRFPENVDQRKDWELRQKLFGQRDSVRVVKQQTAIQTIVDSGVEN